MTLMALAICGCISPVTSQRVLPAGLDETFEAAERVLGSPRGLGMSLAVSDREGHRIETHWRESESARAQGLLLQDSYVERSRYRLRFRHETPESTRVFVTLQSEERPPAGRRAFRWTPVPPDRARIEAVFGLLRRELEGTGHAREVTTGAAE